MNHCYFTSLFPNRLQQATTQGVAYCHSTVPFFASLSFPHPSPLSDLLYFVIILCLILAIFTIIGFKSFPTVFDTTPDSRISFSNPYWAFLTVFQAVTGENIVSIEGRYGWVGERKRRER